MSGDPKKTGDKSNSLKSIRVELSFRALTIRFCVRCVKAEGGTGVVYIRKNGLVTGGRGAEANETECCWLL